MEGDRDSDFDHLSVKELVKIIFTIVPCISDNEHRLLFYLKRFIQMPIKVFWRKKIYIYIEKKEYIHFLFLTYSVNSNFAAKDEKSRKKDDNI